MFQFPGFTLHKLWIHLWIHGVTHVSFLIRRSPDHWLCAPTRSLSQLITSFIGSWCQGIHHAPFVAWPFARIKLRITSSTSSLWCSSIWIHSAPRFSFPRTTRLLLAQTLYVWVILVYGFTINSQRNHTLNKQFIICTLKIVVFFTYISFYIQFSKNKSRCSKSLIWHIRFRKPLGLRYFERHGLSKLNRESFK